MTWVRTSALKVRTIHARGRGRNNIVLRPPEDLTHGQHCSLLRRDLARYQILHAKQIFAATVIGSIDKCG